MQDYRDRILINTWKSEGNSIVLVTGVFDILHLEHFRFLNKARKSGDKLIVGIERDIRVKRIKGKDRPFYTETNRVEQISNLKSVDLAFLLPEKFDNQEDWELLIDNIRPNVYAVSSHTLWLENKRYIAEKFGAKLEIVHEYNPASSSTIIIESNSGLFKKSEEL